MRLVHYSISQVFQSHTIALCEEQTMLLSQNIKTKSLFAKNLAWKPKSTVSLSAARTIAINSLYDHAFKKRCCGHHSVSLCERAQLRGGIRPGSFSSEGLQDFPYYTPHAAHMKETIINQMPQSFSVRGGYKSSLTSFWHTHTHTHTLSTYFPPQYILVVMTKLERLWKTRDKVVESETKARTGQTSWWFIDG